MYVVVVRLFGEEATILRDRELHLLFAANAFSVLGVAMVSPILESLTGPFGVSASEIGLFVTAIAFPAIFLIPVGGVLADRIGRKPILLFGLVVFGGAGAAISLTTEFYIALGLRFFQGVGMAATLPAIVSSIRDLYSNAQEATAQGLRVGVSGTSQAFFSASAGVLVGIAWQYPFLLYALTFPVALAIFVWFEEPMEDPDDDGTAGPDRFLTYARQVLALLVHRRVSPILLAHMATFFALFSFFTYNSLIVGGAAGGGAREAGLIVGLFNIVYAIVATQVGRITARFGTRTIPLLAAHVAVLVGLGVFGLSPNLLTAAIGTFSLAGGMGILAPMYRSLISGFGPREIRGGVVSVGESLGWVAVTTAPILIGASIDAFESTMGTTPALQVALVTVAVVTGVVGIVAVLAANRAPPTDEERRMLGEDERGSM